MQSVSKATHSPCITRVRAAVGREYYTEVEDVDCARANDWVRANVLVHMGKSPQAIKSRAQIRSELIVFVGNVTVDPIVV